MAKTESQRTIASSPMTADLIPAEPPPESLDKVRDILFGGQMRAVEGRLQALEERLLHEQTQMRADLGKQLAADRAKRAEELKALGAEIRESIRSLEKRHVKLEELAGTADAELRDSILEQSRAVNAQFERLSQRVSADLNREVTGLRHDKADLAALAGLFSDMSGRLGSLLGNGPAAGDGVRS